jgi:hypothetical protein
MNIVPKMRAGTLAMVLAAGALVGCSSPDAMVATTNPSVVPSGPGSMGPYSGGDWDAALDAAMTSDNGGE